MQSLSPSSATVLILASCLLLTASVSDARPQARRRPAATLAKSQRQVELVASTPYPAAGFRPSIPFDLPSERQPKLEEPLDTTTSIATSTVVEDFSTTDAQTTTEVEEEQQEEQQQEEEAEQQEEEEQLTEVEANARTPANTYGAPNPVEDTIEVVAQAPSRDFQPPVREAVEDFAAVAIDGVADEQQPVADLPALDQEEQQEEEVTLKATATTPASTYGAPKASTPARSYGAPELEEPDNELEVEESQVELFEEEQQQQQDLSEAAAALGLNSGRLILLPLNAGGAQFGRLILAVEQPKAAATQQRQRQRQLRSERLRRRN